MTAVARWFDRVDRQRYAAGTAALAVFVLLAGIYTLTYSGIFKSSDEKLFVANAVSLGGWGQMTAAPMGLRALAGNVEPLLGVLGAGLFWLARLAHVGIVHTLFLTNVYLTAGTGVVVFLIVRQRGSQTSIALAAALIFGLGTLAWPHTKLYFRDPLAMFFVALALLSFERVFTRVTWYGQGAQWLITLGLLSAGILAKNTAVFALPAFFIIAGVRAAMIPSERRNVLTGLAAGVILGGIALLMPSDGPFRLFALTRYLNSLSSLLSGQVGPAFGQAIVGALMSPGKGLFPESPALLLALVAWPLTDRRGRLWHLTAWLTLLGLVVGLAYYRDYIWFGGTGWGVRHYLPVVPMLAAACAPALEKAANSRRLRAKLAVAGCILLSVFIQVGAALLLPEAYYNWLWRVGQAPWGGAIWNPLYAEAVGYWRLLLSGGVADLAWMRLFPYHAGAVAVLLAAWAAMMLAAVMTLRSSLKEVWPRRTFAVSCGLAGLALTLMPYGLLRAYYPDPAYSPTRADYRAAADYLAQAARPGDAIVIRSRVEPLWNYFINYVYSPVEWYAYEPVVPTDTPPDSVLDEAASAQLLNPETEQLFDEILPQQHARVWHVSDQCADWTFLHLEERWLAKHYAAATSHSFQAQCTTLVSPFALAAAPVDQGAGGIFQFGEAIRLTGFARLAFSEGAPVRPGDILPLRLDWQLVQPVSMDYSIGVYLLDAGGALKAQQDGSARGGFLPMTHWPLNAAVSDQHGLDLPNGLPAGEYQVAVAVYNWQTGERLAVTGATGPAPAGLARLLTVHVGP